DPAALLDQDQRRFPRDRAGGCQRGDLTQRVPSRHRDVLESVALAPDFVRRPANGHDAWLDDVGAVELLHRALETQAPDRHLKDLLGAFEDLACRGVAIVQLAAHAERLDALAREEQSDRTCEAYTHFSRHAPHVSPEP